MIIDFPTEKIDLENCYDSAIDNEKFTKAFSKYFNLDLDYTNLSYLFDTYAIISYSERENPFSIKSVKVLYKDFPKNSSFRLLCK